MARPRQITDERLIAAAGAVISRLGPGFTLADVAGEASVAVGTVAHRFGSKHGLLAAMIKAAIGEMRAQLRQAEHGSRSDSGSRTGPASVAGPGPRPDARSRRSPGAPDDTVVRALVAAYAPLDDSATAANNLAQLAFDLADDRLRRLMAEFYAVMEAEVAGLIERTAGLYGAPVPAVAARILTAVADGTAIHWSAHPHGSLCERLRDDLTAVLAGWRRQGEDR